MKIYLDFRIKTKTKRRISIYERKKDKNILWYKFFNEQSSEEICKYALIFMVKNKRRRKSSPIYEKKRKRGRKRNF